jgi:thiol-disulfide isomerase/thioredoxin
MKRILHQSKAGIIYLCFLLIPLLGFTPARKPLLYNSPLNNNDKIQIIFRLKAGEKCVFDYLSEKWEEKALLFSNPGKADTTLLREVEAATTTTFSYNLTIIDAQNNVTRKKYIYALKPGDIAHFELNQHYFLICSNNRYPDLAPYFFSVPSSKPPFNKKFSFYKSADWRLYYQQLEELYAAKKKTLSETGQALSPEYIRYAHNLLDASFYTSLLSPAWSNDISPGAIEEYARKFIPLIEENLERYQHFLTGNLISVIGGITRYKTFREGQDYKDILTTMATGQKTIPQPFRDQYALYCLRESPDKHTSQYRLAAAQLNFVNPAYQQYAAELVQQYNTIAQTPFANNDQLLGPDSKMISWQDLLNNTQKKYLLLDFWASWCAPCRTQIPILRQIKEKFKNDPVEFISMNLDENKDDWQIAARSENMQNDRYNFYVIDARKSALAKTFRIESLPRYILLDNNGKIVNADFYKPVEPDFEKRLRAYIYKP